MDQITILFFGQLTEIAGADHTVSSYVTDTDALQLQLQAQYPALKATKYIMAVNRKAISQNTKLETGSTVALLPPFSGG